MSVLTASLMMIVLSDARENLSVLGRGYSVTTIRVAVHDRNAVQAGFFYRNRIQGRATAILG